MLTLRMKRRILLVAGLLVIAFALWSLLTGSLFQHCAISETQAANDAAKNYPPISFFSPAYTAAIYGRCAWASVYEFRDAVTAVATALIAIFTLTLWLATTEHSRIQEGLLALSREEFNATHRPRLRVRFLRLHQLQEDRPVIIQLTVVNVGETPAYIQKFEVSMIVDTDSDEKVDPFSLGEPFAPNHKIEGGAACLVSLGKGANIKYDHFWLTGRGGTITVNGRAEYTDDRTVRRRTGFERICGGGSLSHPVDPHRFRPVKGSEYEYED